MKRPAPFWLSETINTFLRYLAVGVALIPAGVVYSLTVLAGWDRWWVATICLTLGFVTAALAWRRTASLEVTIVKKEQVTSQGATLRLSYLDALCLLTLTSASSGGPSGATTFSQTAPIVTSKKEQVTSQGATLRLSYLLD